MRVQPVVMPVSGALSQAVLDDGWPIEILTASGTRHLEGPGSAVTRVGAGFAVGSFHGSPAECREPCAARLRPRYGTGQPSRFGADIAPRAVLIPLMITSPTAGFQVRASSSGTPAISER